MARSSLARRLGVATARTALALSLTACGEGGGDSKATDPSSSETATDPADAEDDLEESEDAEESEEASGDLEELSVEEFYPAVMAALEDAETMGFAVSTQQGTIFMDWTGQLRYVEDGVETTAATTGDLPIEMTLIDDTMYWSGLGIDLPEGKTWLKIDPGDPNSPFSSIGKELDPNTIFNAAGTPKKLELVGAEDVDGVETNLYTVVMDTAGYLDAMGLSPEEAKRWPKEFEMELWVDADNQPRRFRQVIEVDLTGSGYPTNIIKREGTYFDFGTEVDIAAPPAAEVADNVPGMS